MEALPVHAPPTPDGQNAMAVVDGSAEAPLEIAENYFEIEERWMTMAMFAEMMGNDRAVTTAPRISIPHKIEKV